MRELLESHGFRAWRSGGGMTAMRRDAKDGSGYALVTDAVGERIPDDGVHVAVGVYRPDGEPVYTAELPGRHSLAGFLGTHFAGW